MENNWIRPIRSPGALVVLIVLNVVEFRGQTQTRRANDGDNHGIGQAGPDAGLPAVSADPEHRTDAAHREFGADRGLDPMKLIVVSAFGIGATRHKLPFLFKRFYRPFLREQMADRE